MVDVITYIFQVMDSVYCYGKMLVFEISPLQMLVSVWAVHEYWMKYLFMLLF